MQNLPLFIGATLLLAMTPGQDFIYVMIRSASQGARVGFIAVAGLMIGVMLHTLAAATGVAAILLTSSYAFNAIKFLGAAYLIYLGIQSFRQKGKLQIRQKKDKASAIKILREGMLSSTLNPKLALFFMAFLPQFVSPDISRNGDAFSQMLMLGILFALLSLPILLAVAILSARFGNLLGKNQRVSHSIGKLTGLVLIGLGLRLGFVNK